jgi:catechol 2,3-dioxygenase-like lactoylglutathione lyase family enzyme
MGSRKGGLIMTEMSMTHVAIVIDQSKLEQAEAFYRRLFDMEVAFRETMTDKGWATLAADSDAWALAKEQGIRIGLIMLYRGDLAIDLEARTVPEGRGPFSHTGLHVDGQELEMVRERARDSGCSVTFNAPHMVVFDDLFGMRWEVTTLSYADPYALSAGHREGRWFNAKESAEVMA